MTSSSKTKRILYVDNSIGYGGSLICLKLLLANMNRERYYPIVVTSYADQNYKGLSDLCEWICIPNKVTAGETITRYAEKIPGLKRLGGKRMTQLTASIMDYVMNFSPYVIRLLAFANKKKVDLIHLNNEPVANMGGIIVAKILGLPCINHVRGAPLNWDSATARWLYKHLDHFIAVAEWVKRDVMAFDIPINRISTIWDGRELGAYEVKSDRATKRAELGMNTNQLSIGIVGRINPWKGHIVFIDAAEKVLKRFPDCRFFIIGGATEKFRDYEKELKSIVSAQGLEASILFTGQRSDVPEIMDALDIVVHTTLEADPYPGVVIEGMLVGKPVIATNIGGPSEAIEDYKTGILVPPKKPEVLAEKICELLLNTELRLSLGKEARKVASERYSIDNHVRQIEGIYEKVLYQHGKN